jgi:hypothetical protein
MLAGPVVMWGTIITATATSVSLRGLGGGCRPWGRRRAGGQRVGVIRAEHPDAVGEQPVEFGDRAGESPNPAGPGHQTAVHTGSRERRRPDLRAAHPGAAVSAVEGALIVVEELIAHARAAFGWDGDIEVSAGPRGALGQIWRLEIGSARYALKEIFAEPPTEASIQAELAFARRAAEAGVRVPVSHPDRQGRYLLTAPGGRWLRCYDWIDLHPVALTAPDTPRQLGALLARLHRCAPAAAAEPDGGPAVHGGRPSRGLTAIPRIGKHRCGLSRYLRFGTSGGDDIFVRGWRLVARCANSTTIRQGEVFATLSFASLPARPYRRSILC